MREVIFRADPLAGYRADVPSLPGCHAEGKTLTEAVRGVRKAIYAHVAALEAQGKPIPPAFVLDSPFTEGTIRQRLLLREDVVEALKTQFPAEPLTSLLDLVDEYGRQPFEQDAEPIQVAAIRLSEGNIDRLREWIAEAKLDYRDVLMAYAARFGAYP